MVIEANRTTQQYLSLVGRQAVVGYNHNPPGPFQSTRRGMLLYPCRSCMCMICFLVPVSTHALQNNVCVTSPDPSPHLLTPSTSPPHLTSTTYSPPPFRRPHLHFAQPACQLANAAVFSTCIGYLYGLRGIYYTKYQILSFDCSHL